MNTKKYYPYRATFKSDYFTYLADDDHEPDRVVSSILWPKCNSLPLSMHKKKIEGHCSFETTIGNTIVLMVTSLSI